MAASLSWAGRCGVTGLDDGLVPSAFRSGVTRASVVTLCLECRSSSVATASVSGRMGNRRIDRGALVLAAVGVAGVIATAATAWTVAKSPILVGRTADAIWRSLFVAGYVAAGVHAWWRRPESRLGPIVAGYGFLYSVTSMNASADALVYTVGMVVWAVYIVYTGYVFLCFPRGRLEWQLEQRFMLASGGGVASSVRRLGWKEHLGECACEPVDVRRMRPAVIHN